MSKHIPEMRVKIDDVLEIARPKPGNAHNSQYVKVWLGKNGTTKGGSTGRVWHKVKDGMSPDDVTPRGGSLLVTGGGTAMEEASILQNYTIVPRESYRKVPAPTVSPGPLFNTPPPTAIPTQGRAATIGVLAEAMAVSARVNDAKACRVLSDTIQKLLEA